MPMLGTVREAATTATAMRRGAATWTAMPTESLHAGGQHDFAGLGDKVNWTWRGGGPPDRLHHQELRSLRAQGRHRRLIDGRRA